MPWALLPTTSEEEVAQLAAALQASLSLAEAAPAAPEEAAPPACEPEGEPGSSTDPPAAEAPPTAEQKKATRKGRPKAGDAPAEEGRAHDPPAGPAPPAAEQQNKEPEAPKAGDAPARKGRTHDAPPSAPGPAPAPDCAASEWAYAVWSLPAPGDSQIGVHTGGVRAWRALTPHLPGGRYIYPHCRLRRFPSEEAAVDGYSAEAARHGAPLSPQIFRH